MRYATTVAFTGVLSALVFSSTASAQVLAPARSNTQGFHLGIHANGSAHRFDESDFTESGGGLGVRAGWGITNNVMLFVQADAAAVESEDVDSEYTLAHFDAGARFTFSGRASAWRPYGELALSGRAAGQTIEGSDVAISGAGFTGGLGVQYFFTRSLGLDLAVKYTTGRYTRATVDGESFDIDDGGTAMSTRVNFGLSWYPGN